MLFQILFEQQEVVVYDSLCTSSETICDYFQELAKNLPKVFKFFNMWGNRFNGNSLRESWDIIIKEDVPQQADGHSCGILCMKFFECITRGIPLNRVIPSRCGVYRRSYCAKLYKWGVQE